MRSADTEHFLFTKPPFDCEVIDYQLLALILLL